VKDERLERAAIELDRVIQQLTVAPIEYSITVEAGTQRIIDAYLGDDKVYVHDGEPRTSDGNHMTARECEVHAIEWGMVPLNRGDIDEG